MDYLKEDIQNVKNEVQTLKAVLDALADCVGAPGNNTYV